MGSAPGPDSFPRKGRSNPEPGRLIRGARVLRSRARAGMVEELRLGRLAALLPSVSPARAMAIPRPGGVYPARCAIPRLAARSAARLPRRSPAPCRSRAFRRRGGARPASCAESSGVPTTSAPWGGCGPARPSSGSHVKSMIYQGRWRRRRDTHAASNSLKI